MADAEKTSEQFDEGARQANVAFKDLMQSLTPEQQSGINKIISWWKEWFGKAGHKRLGRILIGSYRG